MKVYAAQDGVVWYADGARAPLSSGLDVTAFLEHLAARTTWCVRVLGIARNADLIVRVKNALDARKARDSDAPVRLEIAGPLVCETIEELADPEIALYRMRQCLRSPSLGGWHTATICDLAIYRLLTVLASDATIHEVVNCARQHPAWHDLLFLDGLDPYWAARVLGYIVDPRWFVSPTHPERLTRVRNYLGLTSRTQDQFLEGSHECAKITRYSAVWLAWGGEKQPCDDELERPGYFLWRRCLSQGAGPRGQLRASGAFVAYLVRTWQQQICDLGTSGQHLEMFLPGSMLRPAEEAAYLEHAARRNVLE